tara:strand:+ start:365 stop:535 length:171 start_codon:yes stop_codon:yes gene_type:complete
MFDIRAIDMQLHLKSMRCKANKLARKAALLEEESRVISEQADLLEEEFKDNLAGEE